MAQSELERVVANWLAQAAAPGFVASQSPSAAAWVAERVAEWLAAHLSEPLSEVQASLVSVREELMQLGGWQEPTLVQALQDLTHATDALEQIRTLAQVAGESKQ